MPNAERIVYKQPSEDRRRSPRKVKEQGLENIEQLWGTHQEVIRLYVLGMKEVDIARELDMHLASVGNIVNSNIGRRRILELQGRRDDETIEINDRIKKLRSKAVDMLEGAVDPESPHYLIDLADHHRLRAAESILDRSGHPKMTEHREVRESAYGQSGLDRLKQLAAERGYTRETIDLVPTVESDADEERALNRGTETQAGGRS